jgi:outer membrane protein
MNKFRYLLSAFFLLIAASIGAAEEPAGKIRVVNFKACVEKSKLGKQEQTAFEALKKQMENNLSGKEKTLNEMADKFEDQDYLESLTAEAETELKRKFRTLNQEYTQLQNQYLQALQQTNMKVVQRLTEVVSEAASKVAQQKKLDMILNSEACFFAAPNQDISNDIVTVMDDMYEKDDKMKEGTVPTMPTADSEEKQ